MPCDTTGKNKQKKRKQEKKNGMKHPRITNLSINNAGFFDTFFRSVSISLAEVGLHHEITCK